LTAAAYALAVAAHFHSWFGVPAAQKAP